MIKFNHKIKGYKEEATFAEVRKGLKEEVKKEVTKRYEAGIRERFEKKWIDEKKAEMKKEMQEVLIAKIRG